MITRRSLFASLAGLAVVPAVAAGPPSGGNWREIAAKLDEACKAEGIMAHLRVTLPPFDRKVAAATLDRLIEKARSNLSRPQRDKGAE